MIKSMTAYAKSESEAADLKVTIELKSYNSRYLDIVLRLPYGWGGLEEKIKKFITSRIARGRLEVAVTIKDESEHQVAYDIDLPRAKAYHRALLTLKKALCVEEPLKMEHLINGSGLLKAVEGDKDITACWQVMQKALQKAIEALEAMRCCEGEYISRDFNQRLSFIEEKLSEIKSASSGFLEMYKNRLTERITTLTKGIVTLEPERIAQEAAILADKSDISEELVRAESHLIQYRNFMDDDEPAGRKLNFLLQEFGREFNTMGAKAGKSEISHLIVEIKAELEKLREQVQNVE